MVLITDSQQVDAWLRAVGVGDPSAADIARRAGLNRPTVWMALKRGKLSDDLALKIAAAWGVTPLQAISYATGVSHDALSAAPSLDELPALVHPASLTAILTSRWRNQSAHVTPLEWADSRVIGAAVFIRSGLAKRLELLSEQTGHSVEALRAQFWRNVPIRTAVAAAKVSQSSYAICLLATGAVTPADYNLDLSAIEQQLLKMRIDDLAELTETSIRAFTHMIAEAVNPEEDGYR